MKTTGNSNKPRYKQPIRPDSPPPFHKWCERDFRADTDHMSWLGKALYARLLQSAFAVASTRPNLPADTDQLRRLLSGVPKDTWAAHEEEILTMFTKATVNGIEVLVHKRLQEDFEALADYRFSQSQNKKDYWTKIRTDRKKETEKLATTKLQPSLEPANTEPVATHYQYEVDVEVDSDSKNEKESEGETPQTPPPLSPLPSERARGMSQLVIETASHFDRRINLMPANVRDVQSTIDNNPTATADDVAGVIREMVQVMGEGDIKYAGTMIATNLAGKLREYIKTARQNKNDADAAASAAAAPDDWFSGTAPQVPQTQEDREAI